MHISNLQYLNRIQMVHCLRKETQKVHKEEINSSMQSMFGACDVIGRAWLKSCHQLIISTQGVHTLCVCAT